MTSSYIFVTVLVFFLLGSTFAADAEAWRSRSIYQVLTDRFARSDNSNADCPDVHTYCGGTFVGLKNNLDYIASMGFDAIWISPVVSNYEGGYHGYWATDLYGINPNFGTPEELKDLVNTAHSKDIWVMVDVVANHMGPVVEDFSQIKPFNKPEHYHTRCQINNWDDQNEVEYCRLADLPDLDQSNEYVKQTLLDWIKSLVKDYDFDGIRIDTIPEVDPNFWLEFGKASGVYQIGECFNDHYEYVGNYQNYIDAMLDYPLYYQLKNQFGYRQSMYNWRNHYQTMASHFKNQDLLGTFVDNHDNSRFLHQFNDKRAFKSALAFALSSRGIPMTYYGSEKAFNGGDDPFNREPLWSSDYAETDMIEFFKNINSARKVSQWYNQAQVERYVDDTFYGFSRGSTFFAFTNNPDQQQVRSVSYHPYAEGQVVCNVLFAGDCITVKNGLLNVVLNDGEVKIFVPKQTYLKIKGQVSEGFLAM